MASGHVHVQPSHTLSGDPKCSEPLHYRPVYGRRRQDSSISSVPSTYSGTTYSSRSAYRTSASIPDDPESPPRRESFESIIDDPFFQRYHDADIPPSDKESPDPASAPSRHEKQSSKSRPTPRKESLTIHEKDRLPQSPEMDGINVAVIGAHGVGKSHYIQRAMALAKPPGAEPSTSRITVDNMPFAVTLFEVDLELLDVEPDRQIQWPKQVGRGDLTPAAHAVLLLYDVMNSDSIVELPQTLAALARSSLPTILVATKCDNPENARQVDTEEIHEASKSAIITSFRTQASRPESSRNSLATLLRVIVQRRQEEYSEGGNSRRRAASEAGHIGVSSDSATARPLSPQSKHSRASSDMSLLQKTPSHQTGGHVSTFSDGGDDNQTASRLMRTSGVRLDRQHTASPLDIETTDGDDFTIFQRNENMFERPVRQSGYTFDELVDRLVAPKLSKADSNFAEIFLCLYRKFAAPGKLFKAIVDRLDRLKNDQSVHYLSKASAQLRIIETVAKWVASYPGDFARPVTRQSLDVFIKCLSSEPIFAAATSQMRRNLEYSVVDDDDTGWAQSDDPAECEPEGASRSTQVGSDHKGSSSSLRVDENVNRRPSASSSLCQESQGTQNSQSSSKVHQFQFHSIEDYEREAAAMMPSATMPLTKFRYHIFMDTQDDDIADEMTRIDWVMFSSVRIRDLVRHVFLNAAERKECKGVKNTERMISHFNHVAKWVANMVLMRDKAKHRAQMLEKYMRIAAKLRVRNNYNGLAAILAGINGTSVHRLAQTKSLVSPDVAKRFARLVLLMGTHRSYFAYRMAWENSPPPRIPFMPLHRRDLVSADQGSVTYVDAACERINWNKFEVLGEIILPMVRSQATPYSNLAKHDVARELILDCLMPTDDEEIYQRSIAVEGSSGSAFDSGKKKFPWLPM